MISFNPHKIHECKYYYNHFTDEETEAWVKLSGLNSQIKKNRSNKAKFVFIPTTLYKQKEIKTNKNSVFINDHRGD